MSSMMLVQVYKAAKKEETYLYVRMQRGLEDVPEELLSQFGEMSPVLSLKLTPDKKLARANAQDVLAAIEASGFYLQLPPTPAQLLARYTARE
jgi:uncharacterized protein YcgL (UPF0745 family)